MADVVPATNGVSADSKGKTAGLSRNQLKRLKKKQNKSASRAATESESEAESVTPSPAPEPLPATELESAFEEIDPSKVEGMEAFESVFARFQLLPDEDESANAAAATTGKGEVIYSDDEDEEAADPDAPAKLSKKKQRKIARLSVAELKQLVRKPEVVEWVDVSAQDPRLLVHLKSYRNTVPVPGHWSQKRGYLEGKKGIEKPPYQLPPYIADTGIGTQQDALKEKEDTMSLKQKTRQRVQPKMGKIDIDYQKLHDAFFRFQTPPKMTEYGDIYYEGKEFETHLRERKPGEISNELKEALSIPPLAPPPWLIAMQRYGPPPSYPNLKIPGLNAPIPEGAQWGFHPGGWGKPPVDEYNRPLYGDVFGVMPKMGEAENAEPINREPWGEIEEVEEEEEEEDESSVAPSEDEEEEAAPTDGLATPSGMASVSSTVPGGLETPDFIDLRKGGRGGTESVVSEAPGPRQLYQVIPERETAIRGFMGSERGYDVRGLSASGVPVLGQEERGTKRKAGGVDVALNPEELEGLSQEELAERFEAHRRSTTSAGGVAVPGADRAEDFSDVIAKETAKRQKRDEKRRGDRDRGKEKEKFKF